MVEAVCKHFLCEATEERNDVYCTHHMNFGERCAIMINFKKLCLIYVLSFIFCSIHKLMKYSILLQERMNCLRIDA